MEYKSENNSMGFINESKWMGTEERTSWSAAKEGLQCDASFHYKPYNPYELSVWPNS